MFLSITLDREVIAAYKGYQCVSLIKTHRIICNLTHPGHLVNLTSGQILTLTFQGPHIYVLMRVDKTNTMVPTSTLSLLVRQLWSKYELSIKLNFLSLRTTGNLTTKDKANP